MNIKKVCFIGHRKIFDREIKQKLENAILNEINNGCRLFTMGTHGEFDNLALSICRQLRNKYKDISIEVVITSLNSIKKQFSLTPYSDVKTIMYEIEEEYFKKQIIVSNRHMIVNCDTLICYVDKNKSPSGAKIAMNYATKKGLNIINIF